MECAEVNSTCNASGTCVAVGLPGDPCVGSIDCSTYATCNTTTGKCENFPTLGMPCLGLCTGDAFCDTTTMMCVAPHTNGATCQSDGECETDFCDAAKQCADRMACI